MTLIHPDPDLLLGYAAGALAEGPSLAIACHGAMCAHCQREIGQMESLGGALLSELDPAAMDAAALDAVLARLDQPELQTTPIAVDEQTRRMAPSPLWPYLGGGLDDLRWRRLTPALETADLDLSDGAHRASVLRIRAGRKTPIHTHGGEEMTLVLSGGFTDESGHYGRGDFSYADAAKTHRPIADEGEDCIALAVVDAPARLTGVIGRLFNPLIRR